MIRSTRECNKILIPTRKSQKQKKWKKSYALTWKDVHRYADEYERIAMKRMHSVYHNICIRNRLVFSILNQERSANRSGSIMKTLLVQSLSLFKAHNNDVLDHLPQFLKKNLQTNIKNNCGLDLTFVSTADDCLTGSRFDSKAIWNALMRKWKFTYCRLVLMRSLMGGELWFLNKRTPTMCAWIGPFTCVRSFMALQVALTCERLWTIFAHIWSLTGMGTNVNLWTTMSNTTIRIEHSSI